MAASWHCEPVGPMMTNPIFFDDTRYLDWLMENGISDETGHCIDCEHYEEVERGGDVEAKCRVSGDSMDYLSVRKGDPFERGGLRPNRPDHPAAFSQCECQAFKLSAGDSRLAEGTERR